MATQATADTTEETAQVNFRLPIKLRKEARVKAALADQTFQQWLAETVEQRLEQERTQ